MSEQKFIAAPANGASLESDDLDVRIDDDVTDPTPPVMPVGDIITLPPLEGVGPITSREDGAVSTARDQMIEPENTKTRRARPKMSLRIPDDEVARPSERAPASLPPQDPAPISTPAPAISPSRIIVFNPPSNRPEMPVEMPVELAVEMPVDMAVAEPAAAAATTTDDAVHDAPTRLDIAEIDAGDPLDSADRLTPDPVTTPSPKLAAANTVELGWELSSPALPTVSDEKAAVATPLSNEERAAAEFSSDASDLGVDVQLDGDDSSPSIPPNSDPPEIGEGDLVSIESVPVPRHRSSPPAAPPVPALAYQTGEHPPQTPNSAAVILEAAPPLVIVPPAAPPGATLSTPPNDPSKKRIRPWWEDLFNDDFVRTMAKITDSQIAREATFIEESLGVAKGSALLDLGCGTGLHAIELSKRGYQVVGYDLSLPMLARAADEAQERNQKINFVQGDMRELAFDEMFDGVYSWNTSFGYFDEEKNGQVVARVHRALKKGGQFLLDVVNRDYIIKQSPSLAWFEGDGCICMDEMQIDFITSRMRIKRTMMMDDGRSREIEYSMRIYSLHELGKLLHEHGFRVAEVSGRMATPGVFFGNESPRTLILAEKR